MTAFKTAVTLCGPLRHPRQMLQEQTYEGHVSIHDDNMANDLGFSGAPIEGPTHFSQFDPLLFELFGKAWFENGCISAHYQNMVIEGEEVRAFATPADDKKSAVIWAEKKDGTPVLQGSACIGPNHPESELDRRRARLRPSQQLVILAEQHIGMKGKQDEHVVMGFDQQMGDLYPFSLNEKVERMTEPSSWYTNAGGSRSPWGKAIIPFEMISVLTEYSAREAEIPRKGPAVGLFVDQEIKLIKGPLFVNHPYRLQREVIHLAESRRVESSWTLTKVYDEKSNELVAECILNHSLVKSSYKKYEEEAIALGKSSS
jgi:hypothetical protein